MNLIALSYVFHVPYTFHRQFHVQINISCLFHGKNKLVVHATPCCQGSPGTLLFCMDILRPKRRSHYESSYYNLVPRLYLHTLLIHVLARTNQKCALKCFLVHFLIGLSISKAPVIKAWERGFLPDRIKDKLSTYCIVQK